MKRTGIIITNQAERKMFTNARTLKKKKTGKEDQEEGTKEKESGIRMELYNYLKLIQVVLDIC